MKVARCARSIIRAARPGIPPRVTRYMVLPSEATVRLALGHMVRQTQ
mgnify:CR=1 FL=1